jgi:predicted nucleic acid-binding protein
VNVILRTLSQDFPELSNNASVNPYAPESRNLRKNLHPFTSDGWIHLISMTDEPELRYFHDLPSRLHRGEASSLAIAHQRHWLVLTDDHDARQEAMRQGIMVSGSVGCLVLAVEQHLCSLSQANTWLEQMIGQGYRSPVTDLTPLIKGE